MAAAAILSLPLLPILVIPLVSCSSWLHFFLQNFINVTQTAAELLVFVQKFKMAAAAILNNYFVTLDHPRSPFAVLTLSFKFCVDRVYTFRDIAI